MEDILFAWGISLGSSFLLKLLECLNALCHLINNTHLINRLEIYNSLQMEISGSTLEAYCFELGTILHPIAFAD